MMRLRERSGWIAVRAVCDLLGLRYCELEVLMSKRAKVCVVVDLGERRECAEHGADYRLDWEVEDVSA